MRQQWKASILVSRELVSDGQTFKYRRGTEGAYCLKGKEHGLSEINGPVGIMAKFVYVS
jgi:hypothetical protein